MNYKFYKEIIEYFFPAFIILFLLLFKYISFSNLVLGYFAYCLIIYFSSKTYLYYSKTEFNIGLLKSCPSILNANFKPYFFLPFTFCQFIFFDYYEKKGSQEIEYQTEKVDDEGTKIIWASYKNSTDIHSNPVLLILPGITGKYNDDYVKNMIIEGLNNNFDVVVFQMRTLSEDMKMPINNQYVNFYDDINESIKKIKKVNQKNIYAISFSYGANLLTGYMGTKNLETNYIEGGVSISNPFSMYMSQRTGENTLYEDLITYFEKKNYMSAVNSLNKDKIFIDPNVLLSAAYIKDFDREFFCKILGYKSVDDYYKGISSDKYVKNINKPLLVINAKDDPISTFKGIPLDDIYSNTNIIFIATDKGAHTCFIENNGDFNFSTRQWILKPMIEFLNYLKQNKS